MSGAQRIAIPPKLAPGDRVAILSPSFAAPAVAPDVHEQAMARFTESLGLVPVEFSTTRQLGASAEARAADLNAAFGDPGIRAILTTIGGDDQITVIPHLDPEPVRADPKAFLGYSDNTNILNWLWTHGVAGFHGGSTQVHLGPGPRIDEIHLESLRAALLTGGRLRITDPGGCEDFGLDWRDPRSLHEFGPREPTGAWTWAGPERRVSGPTWGGCLEVISWLGLADRLPGPDDLRGGVVLLETSEELPPATWVRWWIRALGERGILAAAAAVVVARPPASTPDSRPDAEGRERYRSAQSEAILDELNRYNPDAVICIGPPFGHTRPQWILPYGATMTIDGAAREIVAAYDH